MRRFSPISVAAALALCIAAPARSDETIRIKGSDTIGGQMMPAMAEAYRSRGAKTNFVIEALGSGTAFVGLFDGSADIGESSRPITEKEAETAAKLGLKLHEVVIGYDGVMVVVHPSNPVKSLSIMDLSQLFTGKVKSWKQLGGQDRPVRLISRPSYSGTYSFFREKALRRGNAKGPEEFAPETQTMEENGEILNAVANDPGAVSYVGLGWIRPTIKPLAVATRTGDAGIEPSSETVRTGRYPLYRALYMYVPDTAAPTTLAFLRFVLSREGAAVVNANGFIPVDAGTPLPAFVANAPVPAAPASPATAAVQVAHVPQPAAPAAAPTPSKKRELFRVTFPFARTALTAEARDTVDQAADLIRAGGYTAVVTGHADSKGPAEANRTVALARAQAVIDRLLGRGVERALLRLESSGADAPIASNESPVGRAANRRADIELVPTNGR
ncbi:MAG TPA: phosphate ABC transporter substrate-binding/OmpA family protein [Thermoanaerobaculaceae bacterium]|nr:phosphate ABC transporter substrate-binding/OmpA family protein [Thermoanaerobaculaceae bacterium]